jgi:hypothetical protein
MSERKINPFFENRIPFQYGDPRDGDYMIFDCKNLSFSYDTVAKTESVNSSLFSGEARLNGDEANKLGVRIVKISFSLDKQDFYSQNYILSLFAQSPKKLFVYEQGTAVKPVEKVLWQYAEAVSLPKVFSGTEDESDEVKEYRVELKMLPEFYEADKSLSYFEKGQTLYKFNTPAEFQFLNVGAIEFGSYEMNSFPPFSNLSYTEQKEYLNGRLPLSVIDSYINTGVNEVESSFSKILSSTPLFTTSEGLDLSSSLQSRIYLIQLENLNTEEFIHVVNLTTNSDVLIKWTHNVISPVRLLYNSVNNLLYDLDSKTEINPTFYTVDSLTNEFLFFSNYINADKNFNLLKQTEVDELKLQSSSANQISITNLKTFV